MHSFTNLLLSFLYRPHPEFFNFSVYGVAICRSYSKATPYWWKCGSSFAVHQFSISVNFGNAVIKGISIMMPGQVLKGLKDTKSGCGIVGYTDVKSAGTIRVNEE
ncbi:hypothetical protein D3C71_1712060 [compost metagenome]